MLPVIQIGPAAVQTPGLVILIGLWVGVWLAERRALRLRLNPDALNTLVVAGLGAGLVGARLGHIAQHWNAYQGDPWAVVALTPATLWPEAGLAAGFIAALVAGQRQRLPFRPTLDALAPALAILAVSLSAANFCSGEAFGAPTSLPWAVSLWGAARHPTQLYDLVIGLAVFALIWWGPFCQDRRGLNGLLAAAGLAAGRLITEGVRGDSVVWAGGWRAAQIVALIILTVALIGLRRWSRPAAEADAPAPLHGG